MRRAARRGGDGAAVIAQFGVIFSRLFHDGEAERAEGGARIGTYAVHLGHPAKTLSTSSST